jgi:hypothetical protein
MNKIFAFLLLCCTVSFYSCQKEYSIDIGSVSDATGSLWDSAGNCLPEIVHGTFYNGITPGSDTAYVEIQVNVAQTGAYNIISDLKNGFQFLDSGFFSNTGINTIRLKPIGVPILPVSTVFNIIFDSSLCSFSINVQDSTGTGLGGGGGIDTTGDLSGSWQFSNDSGGVFQGAFDTAVILIDTTIWGSGGKMLYMVGFPTNSPDTAITLIMYLPTGVITPGAYNTQFVPPANAAIFAFNFTTGAGDAIYEAFPDLPSPPAGVTITISSYDNTTHTVTGTFSGTADDAAYTPATIGILNGSFTAVVQ